MAPVISNTDESVFRMINGMVENGGRGGAHRVTKVKTCGLRTEKDIEYANMLKPDFAGFILAPDFPKRYVAPEDAALLREKLDPSIMAVGVFVDQPLDDVVKTADTAGLDMIQLHGSEDDEYIRKLQEASGKKVIKAFKIRSKEDIEKAVRSAADFILLDNGTGTGEKFDWSLLESERKNIKRPFFLAGGLSPDNVAEAIRRIRPYAVDTSSGIESDGHKNYILMKEFISETRSL
ncbi:MAG: phosphoribosylanthranilate isomerase [Anaerovoracaceae bacterium]